MRAFIAHRQTFVIWGYRYGVSNFAVGLTRTRGICSRYGIGEEKDADYVWNSPAPDSAQSNSRPNQTLKLYL